MLFEGAPHGRSKQVIAARRRTIRRTSPRWRPWSDEYAKQVIGPLDDIVAVALCLRDAGRQVPRDFLLAAWPGEPRLNEHLLGQPREPATGTRALGLMSGVEPNRVGTPGH